MVYSLFFKNLLPTGSGSMHGMHNHIQALFKEFLAATVFLNRRLRFFLHFVKVRFALWGFVNTLLAFDISLTRIAQIDL